MVPIALVENQKLDAITLDHLRAGKMNRPLALIDFMKYSALEQFARLKLQLVQERDSIISRLAAINQVFGNGESIPAPSSASIASQSVRKAAYTPREGSLPAKILAAVEKAGDSMSVKDIAAAVRKSPMLVSQACVMLKRKGGLKKRGRGAYALPNAV